ncbi:MAG TPA: replicative DNA helicase, partial [Firmicutes bacterium]|nr:replicative DNA helicase [Bacillota bacterium]
EMSKEQIVERILEYTAEVNFHKLRTGIFSDEDWKKLGRAYGPLYDAPIYIDDSSDISVLEIRTKARRLKSKENLGMIVVDYLQLMHLRRKVENRVQEISEITRSLKKLAREVGVPVLVISQLSRAIEKREDKRPMLSDLRESGSIEQDADVVMFLSVKDEDKTKDTNIVDLIVAKNRNGPLGKIKLKFLKQFAKFLEMEYRFEEEGEEEPFV